MNPDKINYYKPEVADSDQGREEIHRNQDMRRQYDTVRNQERSEIEDYDPMDELTPDQRKKVDNDRP